MPRERIQSYVKRNPDGSMTYVKAYWRDVPESSGEIKKPKGFREQKRVPHGNR